MKHTTRFRAYQLSNRGSSMSLSVNSHFTLIEARYNDDNKEHIQWELDNLNKNSIDALHITSWDSDHCNSNELLNILIELHPFVIEYPSYQPDSTNGRESLNYIQMYKRQCPSVSIIAVGPGEVLASDKKRLCGRDVLYNPVGISSNHNDNSIVKLFRCGSFQILSLGDCESEEISKQLLEDEILQKEVDVVILAHHGSVNSIVTPEFLDAIKAKVAICTVDYKNQFGHPSPKVVRWLYNRDIPYISTKTGDVIIQTIDTHTFVVSNYESNNDVLESRKTFTNKTYYPDDIY